MSWFAVIKEGSVFSAADDSQRRMQEEQAAQAAQAKAQQEAQRAKLAQEAEARKKKQTQVKEQAIQAHTPQLGENTAETDDTFAHFDPDMQSAEQLEHEKWTQQKAKEAEKRANEKAKETEKRLADEKRLATNLKRRKKREATRAKDYREQLKEGAKETVAGLNPFQDRGTGSKIKDFGANLGSVIDATTAKLPQNVGRVADAALAPVFSPIQTARKVGSFADKVTGGAAGRITKPVREAISDTASGAAELGRNIARGTLPDKRSGKGVPTHRFTGNKMGTEETMEQFDTGSYAGREVEFMGRSWNPETGKWEKPGKDDIYQMTAADKAYNAKRKELETLIRDPNITSDEREAYRIQLADLKSSGASGELATQGTTGENYTRAAPSRFMHQLMYGDRPLSSAGQKKLERIKTERGKEQ